MNQESRIQDTGIRAKEQPESLGVRKNLIAGFKGLRIQGDRGKYMVLRYGISFVLWQ